VVEVTNPTAPAGRDERSPPPRFDCSMVLTASAIHHPPASSHLVHHRVRLIGHDFAHISPFRRLDQFAVPRRSWIVISRLALIRRRCKLASTEQSPQVTRGGKPVRNCECKDHRHDQYWPRKYESYDPPAFAGRRTDDPLPLSRCTPQQTRKGTRFDFPREH
jgi:hypothetical protein